MPEIPFDIFEPDRKPRETSAREKEHNEQISYQKYTSAKSVACWDCTNEPNGIRMASVVRRQAGDASYLCARHAQTRRDAEALAELARKDSARHKKNAKR